MVGSTSCLVAFEGWRVPSTWASLPSHAGTAPPPDPYVKRPEWWPDGWKWPGRGVEERPSERAETTAARHSMRSSRAEDSTASFLAVLTSAFGAEHASLYHLDRAGEYWRRERSDPDEAMAPTSIRAKGHPLTWCARERLVVQIPASELREGPAGVSWLLAGGLPGGGRVLVLAFAGAPPTAARRAMGAAVEHLSSLASTAAERGRTN